MHVFLIAFQALNNPRVGFQTAFPKLIQVVHHVVIRLPEKDENVGHKIPIITRERVKLQP